MDDAVLKTDLFQRLGYGNNHDLIERVLEEAGLSRPSKQGIARSKEAAVSAALRAHFVIVCPRGDCQAEALHDGRVIAAAAAPSFCAICGGSSNGRAVDDMVGALKAAGMCRLCVVGGSPSARTELHALVAGRIELRLIDGMASRSSSDAKGDMEWADVVAIWGGTQLAHRVSLLYKGETVVRLARRSIRDLAAEVASSVSGNGRRGFRRP